MPTKVVDTILPTTMIGSYPKPRWYTRYNLGGADLLEWWKLEEYERLGGFTKAKLPNPLANELAKSDDADVSQVARMHNWGGPAVTGEVSQGIPGRLGEMYQAAVQLTDRPLKVSVGAGPPNLTFHVDYGVPGPGTRTRGRWPRTSSRSSTPTSRISSRAAPSTSRSRTRALGGWTSSRTPNG